MPKDESSMLKLTYSIYILYLGSLFFPILPIIAIVIAYIFENDAKFYLQSHFQYLIRSFWISLLYFTIAGITIFLLIGFILLPVCIIWWIIRMVKGLRLLMRKEPIPVPKTWLF